MLWKIFIQATEAGRIVLAPSIAAIGLVGLLCPRAPWVAHGYKEFPQSNPFGIWYPIYGGFHKWEYPNSWVAFLEKIPLYKGDDDWGYPYFRKPPYLWHVTDVPHLEHKLLLYSCSRPDPVNTTWRQTQPWPSPVESVAAQKGSSQELHWKTAWLQCFDLLWSIPRSTGQWEVSLLFTAADAAGKTRPPHLTRMSRATAMFKCAALTLCCVHSTNSTKSEGLGMKSNNAKGVAIRKLASGQFDCMLKNLKRGSKNVDAKGNDASWTKPLCSLQYPAILQVFTQATLQLDWARYGFRSYRLPMYLATHFAGLENSGFWVN